MENFDYSYMGPLIKNARAAAQMTQEELAERVGVSTRYIMAIENEEKWPALDNWFRIIRALHTSADTIVYPESHTERDENEQLILMIRMLNHRDKEVAKTMIQAMLNNQ